MPTVLRARGYRLYFYSHEPNEPPHVHVDKAGASVKVWLDPVVVARNAGFSPTELAEVVRLVQRSQAALLKAWHEFFR
jgi:Domain of unknown function (DUF4160)